MRPALEAWFLREWQRTSAWQLLLRPLSWLFGALAASRRLAYRAGLLRAQRVDRPVIVIGNINVGGTGKTPLVLATVELLEHAGYRCGIVTRGYRRGASGKGTPAGDEELLLAARSGVPVFADRDRVAAARRLLEHHPAVQVIVSDDGLQHYALRRDLEVAVIDGARGLGNRALLPAGPLREAPRRLESVDAIVVNRAATTAAGLRVDTSRMTKPAFAMHYGGERLHAVGREAAMDPGEAKAQWRGKRIVAIAGIGNPQRFFQHLARLGLPVAETQAFPDHHPFRKKELAALKADVILMTEKDAVKCIGFNDPRLWALRISAELPQAYGDLLLNRLRNPLP
ncbi:MAG TPA: tetraacyldisaccharide 4'-kinase [Usitatibacteraceae bacterium]|nr:tetraacyldisaccharide 4'-kinase [Usitatibacteraceae bacterium]